MFKHRLIIEAADSPTSQVHEFFQNSEDQQLDDAPDLSTSETPDNETETLKTETDTVKKETSSILPFVILLILLIIPVVYGIARAVKRRKRK